MVKPLQHGHGSGGGWTTELTVGFFLLVLKWPTCLCTCSLLVVPKVGCVPSVIPEAYLSSIGWVTGRYAIEEKAVSSDVSSLIAMVADQSVVPYCWSSRYLAVPAL